MILDYKDGALTARNLDRDIGFSTLFFDMGSVGAIDRHRMDLVCQYFPRTPSGPQFFQNQDYQRNGPADLARGWKALVDHVNGLDGVYVTFSSVDDSLGNDGARTFLSFLEPQRIELKRLADMGNRSEYTHIQRSTSPAKGLNDASLRRYY